MTESELEQPFSESASIGAVKQPHGKFPGRWADGTAAPANQLARTELGAVKQHASLLVTRRDEIKARVCTDLGVGDDGLSAALEGLVVRYAETSILADSYFEHLEQQGGPLTSRGRQRSAMSGYLQVLDRQVRLAQLIGLERRQRPVNPLDAIRLAVNEANR